MRLVRFLQRAFVEGRIVEPGEEMLISDHIPLGAHMVDVRTGETGDLQAAPPHTPLFLDHTGDKVQDSGSSGYYQPRLADIEAARLAPVETPADVAVVPVVEEPVSQDDPSGD